MKKSRPPKPAVDDASPQLQTHQKACSPWLLNPALHLALILLAGCMAYFNSFAAPFTFDDNTSIVDNPVIKNLSSFLSGTGYAYNPRRFVGYLTIALNYHFGGLDVFGYHLVNLAIHLATALLVYAFARITFRTPFFSPFTVHRSPLTTFIPVFAALLFVAHPIQTQAVTYIIQRLASLVTLFYLAAVVCYVKARLAMVGNGGWGPGTGDREKQGGETEPVIGEPGTGNRDSGLAKNPLFSGRVVGWFVLSLLCTVLAMRTKEVAATLPLAIVLYEFSFFGAQGRKRLLILTPALLTLLIIPIGILVSGKPAGELLSDVSAMTRETVDISRGDYLLTQFSVIATYIRLLFLPINQNLDYDYPVFHSLFTPQVLLSFLLICGLIGLAAWLYIRSVTSEKGMVNTDSKPIPSPQSPIPIHRLIAFGIAWFFITLLVESSFIPIRDVIFEHRLYLPTVGAFVAIAAGLAMLAKYIPGRALTAAATIIILALTGATIARNTIWNDELRLWHDALAKSPGKTRPYKNLGLLLKKRGELDEAIRYFQQAIMLKPDFESYDNLGVAYYEKGLKADALKLLEHAKELNPDYAPIYTNLGKIYLDADDIPNAFLNLKKACLLAPDSPKANNNLGSAYLKTGNYPQAILHLQMAIRHTPEDLNARYNLSVAYYMTGSRTEALQELERVLRLNPRHEEARNLLRLIKESQ